MPSRILHGSYQGIFYSNVEAPLLSRLLSDRGYTMIRNHMGGEKLWPAAPQQSERDPVSSTGNTVSLVPVILFPRS